MLTTQKGSVISFPKIPHHSSILSKKVPLDLRLQSLFKATIAKDLQDDLFGTLGREQKLGCLLALCRRISIKSALKRANVLSSLAFLLAL
jgi:hypothetical protein